MSESPIHKKYNHKLKKKVISLKTGHKPESADQIAAPDQANAKVSTFQLAHDYFTKKDYPQVKAVLLKEARAPKTTLLMQAKLFYQYAEYLELQILALYKRQDNQMPDIISLKKEAFEYYKRARADLLAVKLESKDSEADALLEFLTEKLRSHQDADVTSEDFDQDVVDTNKPMSTVEQPTSYLSQHCSLPDLFSSGSKNSAVWHEAIPGVLRVLRRAGLEYVITGGLVRDKVLGKEFFDVDISVACKSLEDIAQLFNPADVNIVGKKHPILHITSGLKTFEISLLSVNPDGSVDYKADTAKRFIKLDAMIYVPKLQAILDYHNAFEDVKNKTVTLIEGSFNKLLENPIQILRVIRHAAKYNYGIDRQILDFMPTCRGNLLLTPPDSSYTEMYKTLTRGYSIAAIKILLETNLLDIFFPDLEYYWKNPHYMHFIKNTLGFFDNAMIAVHQTGIFSCVSLEFCFAILLWPSLHSKLEKLPPPHPGKNDSWLDFLDQNIEAIFKETKLCEVMPFKVRSYLTAIWNIFYCKRYQLEQRGLLLNYITMRDAGIFIENYALSESKEFEKTNGINSALLAIGFYSLPNQVAQQTDAKEAERLKAEANIKNLIGL